VTHFHGFFPVSSVDSDGVGFTGTIYRTGAYDLGRVHYDVSIPIAGGNYCNYKYERAGRTPSCGLSRRRGVVKQLT
jgi:hypothetical protein